MIIDKKKVKRILCIKLRGIGDVVLSTNVITNLRNNFPDAQIDFLTEPPSKSVLQFNPHLHEILYFDKKKKYGSFSVIFDVMKKQYDLVIDLYSNPRSAVITYLSFASYRAGFPYKGRGYAYNLKGPLNRVKYHNAELHLELLREIGIPADVKELFIAPDPLDLKFADDYFENELKNPASVIGLSPSGGWPSKKCDPVKFAEIADRISQDYNTDFLILWGPGDQKEAEEIHRLMKSKNTLAPATTVGGMMGLMKKCTIIIANDSGPMHIASAIGTPVLSIHGPTNPKMQGPYGAKHEWIWNEELECIECNLLECPKKHECFLQLDTEKVINKIEILLAKNNLNLEKR